MSSPVDPFTQAQDPLLAAATPTACPSGCETGNPPVPMAVHMDSADIADIVRAQAATCGSLN
jgi:hypothetical protein